MNIWKFLEFCWKIRYWWLVRESSVITRLPLITLYIEFYWVKWIPCSGCTFVVYKYIVVYTIRASADGNCGSIVFVDFSMHMLWIVTLPMTNTESYPYWFSTCLFYIVFREIFRKHSQFPLSPLRSTKTALSFVSMCFPLLYFSQSWILKSFLSYSHVLFSVLSINYVTV